MSTSSQFTGRIQARGQYQYNNAEKAGESLLPGNLVQLQSSGNVGKVGSEATEPGVAFQVAVTDLFQGTYGNYPASSTNQWDRAWESGQEVQTEIPQAGSRYWVRTTADEIEIGDLLQIEPSTGRVHPYGSGSVNGYIIGVARTGNVGNEQSDSAAADDLVLVEFS